MAGEFIRLGYKVDIFAAKDKVKRFSGVVEDGVTINNFSTGTSAEALTGEMKDIIKWTNSLGDMACYDIVVSDNLPEILRVRKDAVLSAQFFWHEVLEGVNEEYARECRYLLRKYRPTVVGDYIFTMDTIKNLPGYRSTELWFLDETNSRSRQWKQERSDMLITGGSTAAIRKAIDKIGDYYALNRPKGVRIVWIDKESYRRSYPEYIRPALFDKNMFASLGAALCRPGLGVVTDLLAEGIVPLCIFERHNKEMVHNAECIRRIEKSKSLCSEFGVERTRMQLDRELKCLLQTWYDEIEVG